MSYFEITWHECTWKIPHALLNKTDRDILGVRCIESIDNRFQSTIGAFGFGYVF